MGEVAIEGLILLQHKDLVFPDEIELKLNYGVYTGWLYKISYRSVPFLVFSIKPFLEYSDMHANCMVFKGCASWWVYNNCAINSYVNIEMTYKKLDNVCGHISKTKQKLAEILQQVT